jgi:hypothetical protein
VLVTFKDAGLETKDDATISVEAKEQEAEAGSFGIGYPMATGSMF